MGRICSAQRGREGDGPVAKFRQCVQHEGLAEGPAEVQEDNSNLQAIPRAVDLLQVSMPQLRAYCCERPLGNDRSQKPSGVSVGACSKRCRVFEAVRAIAPARPPPEASEHDFGITPVALKKSRQSSQSNAMSAWRASCPRTTLRQGSAPAPGSGGGGIRVEAAVALTTPCRPSGGGDLPRKLGGSCGGPGSSAASSPSSSRRAWRGGCADCSGRGGDGVRPPPGSIIWESSTTRRRR